jgi:ribosomal protein L37AE/L43A
MLRIDANDQTQRWRYQCPECGSKNWRAINGFFECRCCDARIDEIEDGATGDRYARDEVEFTGAHASWKAPHSRRAERYK